MKALLALLLSLSLAACGTEEETHKVDKAMPILPDDKEVVDIVHQFYSDAQRFGRETDRTVDEIRFISSFTDQDAVRPETFGTCTTKFKGGTVKRKYIELIDFKWNKASSIKRRTILYHELGHCALNLKHAEEGIMEFGSAKYERVEENWDTYVAMLFKSE